MLLFPNTRIELTGERPLVAGTTIDAEGSALIAIYTAGVLGVKPSTGAANEKFVGFSLSRPLAPTRVPVVEVLTVPANGIVVLKAPIVASTARVTRTDTGAAYTQVVIAPAAATEVQVNVPGSLIFQTGQAGVVIQVVYQRDLTVAQAIMLQGNQDVGGAAGAYFGQVGMITRGDVWTTEFDTTVDWSSPTDLRLGAGGKLTLGGSGTVVPGYVLAPPSDGSGWLGVHFSAN